MFDSQTNEIKNRLDIVEVISGYIRLQKAGRNYKANCPFHNEKTPSFSVSPERQIWHCFGCNEGGDIFTFVMKIEGLEFGDALKLLAQRAGVTLKKENLQLKNQRQKLYEICEWATKFFEKQLWENPAAEKMRRYLIEERGLQIKIAKQWRLGYAPAGWRILYDFLRSKNYKDAEILQAGLIVKKEELSQDTKYETQNTNHYDRFRDRLMFPIFDINSQVVGFSGRLNPFIKDQTSAKYINTPQTFIYDKGRILYGLPFAKAEIRKMDSCILVEGNMDALMSHQAGNLNTLAPCGTALSEDHLKFIKRYTDNLIIAFDADAAGANATNRAIDLARQKDFNVKIVYLKEHDPADLVKKDPEQWRSAVQNAQNIMEFYFSTAFARYAPADGSSSTAGHLTAENKKQIAQMLLPAVKKIKNKIEQAHWLQELGQRINVEEKILREQLTTVRDEPAGTNKQSLAKPILTEAKDARERLEQRVIGLLLLWLPISQNTNDLASNLKQPIFNWQEEIKSDYFRDKNLAAIFNDLKEGREIPESLHNLKNDLIFQIEAPLAADENTQKNIDEKRKKMEYIQYINAELDFGGRELKKQIIKQKLRDLEKNIKELEIKLTASRNDTNSDFLETQLKELLQAFKNLSQELS